MPIDLKTAVIFYAAPAPTPPGKIIGSIGPTTSYRMDFFTPKLIENGLKGMIGKGSRSAEIVAALKNMARFISALSAACCSYRPLRKKVELVAYEDIGPEAIRKLTVVDFPAVVINDAHGNDLYLSAQNKWRIQSI